MHDFDAWKWVELRISVGDIALCTVTGLAAWLVSSVLARHQTADRALKDLTNALCRETLDMTVALTESVDQIQKSPGGRAVLGPDMFVRAQRLSNSIHSIEIAASEGKLGKMKTVKERIGGAKGAFEPLNTYLLDAVVNKSQVGAAEFRQVEGLIRGFRESVIRIQLALV
jgi:hypothetical protein